MDKLLFEGAGKTRLKRAEEDRRMIMETWEESGLLDGIEDEHMKGCIAQLCENQMEALLKEDVNVTNRVGTYDTVLFPIVRRTFARLLANEIVSVQPINLPAGLIFYLDADFAPAPGTTYETHASTVYERHYAMSGFEGTRGQGTLTLGDTGTCTTAANGTASGQCTVNYSATNHTESLASLRIYDTGGTEWTDACYIDKQTWARDLFASNQIILVFTGSVASNQVYATWNEYAAIEGDAASAVSRIRMRITSTTVQAESRKMRTEWTQEMAEDLAAYHGENAEGFLTDLMSQELAAEIDRGILRDLIRGAAYQRTWNYNKVTDPASGYLTQKIYNQTLVTEINKVSAAIQKWTLGPGANWIVTSPEMAAVIDDLDNFKGTDAAPDKDQFGMGIERVGTVGSRYTVYKDAYFTPNVLLIGYKGSNFMETGYVYAPYVPFQFTPVVYDADDFVPHKGIRTRYATKFVNNRYYGKILCQNIETL